MHALVFFFCWGICWHFYHIISCLVLICCLQVRITTILRWVKLVISQNQAENCRTFIPRHSILGIFTCIWLTFMVHLNAGKYTMPWVFRISMLKNLKEQESEAICNWNTSPGISVKSILSRRITPSITGITGSPTTIKHKMIQACWRLAIAVKIGLPKIRLQI